MTIHSLSKVHENHRALYEVQRLGALHEHSVPHMIDIMLKVSSEVGRIMNLVQ